MLTPHAMVTVSGGPQTYSGDALEKWQHEQSPTQHPGAATAPVLQGQLTSHPPSPTLSLSRWGFWSSRATTAEPLQASIAVPRPRS